MRVLVVGSGGVGSAFVAIASNRDVYEHITVADIDLAKAQAAVATARNTRRWNLKCTWIPTPGGGTEAPVQ